MLPHTRGSQALVLSSLKSAPKGQMSPVLLDSGVGWSSEVLTAARQNEVWLRRSELPPAPSLQNADLRRASLSRLAGRQSSYLGPGEICRLINYCL